MSFSPRLMLPYLLPSQAQKHVTVNETIQRLDALVQAAVESRGQNQPPASPLEGQGFIIGDTPSGAWDGYANHVAMWMDTVWVFHVPVIGWRFWVIAESLEVFWSGQAWQLSQASGDTSQASLFGVNTAADTTNRLAVKSDAVLFSHDDVTPGNGDVRIMVNKVGVGQTASLEFQSDWSGRIEMGMLGNEDFVVKTSADGAVFTEALRIDHVSGLCSFPQTVLTDRRQVILTDFSGTYSVPVGVKALKVTVIGGGGGGAGAETPSTAVFVGAGGGGAGGCCTTVIPNSALASNYTYSVGAGGAGGTASSGDPLGSRDGGDGGESRFEGGVISLIASGGSGATEDLAVAGASEFIGGGGGAATGGQLNLPGQQGGGGVTKNSQFYQIGTGEGASGPVGQGGAFRNGDGLPGRGFGVGGSGCGMIPGYAVNRAGGAGADGVIIIEEYY